MIIMVLGDSGSGKSEYAENLIQRIAGDSPLYYIATMKPYGKEAEQRILRHRQLRAQKGFQTVECYRDIGTCKACSGSSILLECMSNLTANEMFDGELHPSDQIYRKICRDILRISKNTEKLVIVSNDIFCDGVVYDSRTMEYIHLLGRINSYLAKISQTVIEVVYSCPVYIKGSV